MIAFSSITLSNLTLWSSRLTLNFRWAQIGNAWAEGDMGATHSRVQMESATNYMSGEIVISE